MNFIIKKIVRLLIANRIYPVLTIKGLKTVSGASSMGRKKHQAEKEKHGKSTWQGGTVR